MLKKFGLGSIITGAFILIIGIWMLGSGADFFGYSSGMRSFLEFAPFLFMILGGLGILAGIFYLSVGMKPTSKCHAKVVEKNGTVVTVEFEDGTRKVMSVLGKVSLIVGDEGTIGYKGNIITEFTK